MRGKWLLFSGCVILLAIAAGAVSHLWKPQPAKAPAAAPAVSTATDVNLPGTIQAQHVVSVAAPSEGKIGRFDAEVGQEVYQGQLLAQISSEGLDAEQAQAMSEVEKAQNRVNGLDAELMQARLDASRAEAEASRAKGELERMDKLYQRQQLLYREGATPRLVFEKTEREYNTARDQSATLSEVAKQAEDRAAALTQEIETARRQLSAKTDELERVKAEIAASELHSPVTGIVVARRGAVGDDVDSTTKDLFQIATDLSELNVTVIPPPLELKRMRPGLNAIVRVAENGNEPMPGMVREIKGGQVMVEFQNPNPAVKPGLTAQVQIKLT